MSSRYAEASLKIVADTKDYETKLRGLGTLTDKEVKVASDRFRKGMEAQAKAAAQAAQSTEKASKQITDLGKVMRLAVPQAGALGEKFGGLATVIEGGGAKMALMAAGAGVVVAAIAGIGSMALDTARNIDDMVASIGGLHGDEGLAAAVDQAHEFNDATADLNREWTALKILLSGPVLGALTPVVTMIERAVEGLDILMDPEGFKKRLTDQSTAGWGPKPGEDWMGRKYDPAHPGQYLPADSGSASAPKPVRSSNRARSGPSGPADIVGEGPRSILEELDAQYRKIFDDLNTKGPEAVVHFDDVQAKAHQDMLDRLAAEDEAFQHSQEVWREMQQQRIEGAQSMIASLSGVVSAMGDLWTQSTDDAREAARRQATIARTLAVFQLAQDLAKAISAAIPWAAATGPGAAAAVPAIFGTFTAVFTDIMGMLAPVPKFHTGGKAPDEMGATLKRGEMVVSAPAVAGAGGPDAVRRKMNGGDMSDALLARILAVLERIEMKPVNGAPVRAWST